MYSRSPRACDSAYDIPDMNWQEHHWFRIDSVLDLSNNKFMQRKGMHCWRVFETIILLRTAWQVAGCTKHQLLGANMPGHHHSRTCFATANPFPERCLDFLTPKTSRSLDLSPFTFRVKLENAAVQLPTSISTGGVTIDPWRTLERLRSPLT